MSYLLRTSSHYDRVKEFMRGARQETPSTYTVPSDKLRIARARLLLEETLETVCYGLGVQVRFPHFGTTSLDPKIMKEKAIYQVESPDNIHSRTEFDPIETIDGVMDMHVVATGTLVALGLPDLTFLEEVDNNNLKKIATGKLNPETGKFEKSPDHVPPDIRALFEQVKHEQQIQEEVQRALAEGSKDLSKDSGEVTVVPLTWPFNITFNDPQTNSVIGSLALDPEGQLHFEGRADEAAKVFIDSVRLFLEEAFQQEVERRIAQTRGDPMPWVTD